MCVEVYFQIICPNWSLSYIISWLHQGPVDYGILSAQGYTREDFSRWWMTVWKVLSSTWSFVLAAFHLLFELQTYWQFTFYNWCSNLLWLHEELLEPGNEEHCSILFSNSSNFTSAWKYVVNSLKAVVKTISFVVT